MKKESAEALQWFVDFANLNLESIKPGDKAKLLVEAEEYLLPNKEERRELENAKILAEFPKQLARVAWVEKIPPKESEKYWDSILHLQKVAQKLFLKFLSVPAPTGGGILGQDEMLWRVAWGLKSPFKIKFVPITESPDEYVDLKILLLLEGFPGHAIRKCPGCEKFFFNPTRREKNFCSPRCMSKILTRKRREADREGYNKYQSILIKDLRREKKGLKRLRTKPRKQSKEG